MTILADAVRTAPASPFRLGDGPPVTRARLAELIQTIGAEVAARQPACVVTHTSDAAQIVAALAACEATRVSIAIAHATLPEAEVCDVCRTLGARAFLNDALDWVPVAGAPDVPAAQFTVSLMTSGTTGRPKIARHRLDSLLARIPRPAGAAMHGDARWLLTYQPTTFAGLQVMLTVLCTGAAMVQASRRTPGDLVTAAERWRVTHISGTPTFWRSFLLAASSAQLRLQQITLGGEAVDQPTLDRLTERFPGARITHIYASSEAGALFAVHDRRAGFPRAWLECRMSGVGLRVRDGVLQVESPRRMLAYAGQGAPPLTDDGWLVTGDLVAIDGDRVSFQGRTDEVLNVGGAKVMPQEVEAFLLSCPGVAEVRVRGVRNAISGQALAADVVLAQGFEPERHRLELMRRCQATLPAHKAPRLIRVVPEIPVAVSGKKA